jgi:hypothetical protein
MRGSRRALVGLTAALATAVTGDLAHASVDTLVYDRFNKPGYSLADSG